MLVILISLINIPISAYPGLGLKRGLGENRVVAPYATGLAVTVDPSAAVVNLRRLTEMGGRGRYGFYEAVDFTPTRVQEGESFALVRSFMAHHQGMTIVAIANALFDGAMRERFHAEPIIRATELLLQERVPREVASTRPWAAEVKSAPRASEADPSGGRKIASPHLSIPSTLLLSNGRYAVMLTAAGSGYSRWGDIAITRWREDATRDESGSYIYLRDMRSGALWSAGFQPTGAEPDEYSVLFNEDRAEFTRRDGALTTTLDVLVSAEDDAEVRRVTITNAGVQPRNRNHVLRRVEPGAAERGCRASRLRETLRRNRIPPRSRRDPGDAAQTGAHRARNLGRASERRQRRVCRQAGIRDRPGALARSRAWRQRADRDVGRAAFDQFDRSGARPDLCVAPSRPKLAPGATVRVAFWTMAARN